MQVISVGKYKFAVLLLLHSLILLTELCPCKLCPCTLSVHLTASCSVVIVLRIEQVFDVALPSRMNQPLSRKGLPQ